MPYTYNYPRPSISADAIVFWKSVEGIRLLLVQRKNEPYANAWALPGGFMDMDETVEQAAKRELEEETSLILSDFLQVGCYSKVDRDPRGRVVTVAFTQVISDDAIAQQVQAKDDAQDLKWHMLSDLPALAFDHQQIVQDAYRLLVEKRLILPENL